MLTISEGSSLEDMHVGEEAQAYYVRQLLSYIHFMHAAGINFGEFGYEYIRFDANGFFL